MWNFHKSTGLLYCLSNYSRSHFYKTKKFKYFSNAIAFSPHLLPLQECKALSPLYALSVWSHPHFKAISTHSKSDLSKNTNRDKSKALLWLESHGKIWFLLPSPAWLSPAFPILRPPTRLAFLGGLRRHHYLFFSLGHFLTALVPSTWNSFPFPVPSSTLANLLFVLQLSV